MIINSFNPKYTEQIFDLQKKLFFKIMFHKMFILFLKLQFILFVVFVERSETIFGTKSWLQTQNYFSFTDFMKDYLQMKTFSEIENLKLFKFM